LVEKGNRSGSRRTVESYSRMLWPLFAERSKTPEPVKPADVLAWVHGIGRSGRTPSATTVGARIACLSSLYRFLIRMGLVVSNPTDTVAGRRDRAILLTLVLTGRRRAEVIGLTAGDLSIKGDTVFYSYRGKGGKRGRRELPRPAYAAICATLADAGKELVTMAPDESLWQAAARPQGVTSGTFYARFRQYLKVAGLSPTGIHVLRHTAAKLRRDAGESIEDVSAFLDHSGLAVTTVYLRRLEGQEDRAWRDVAVAIGL
jgi:site-specific recombinase XerD